MSTSISSLRTPFICTSMNPISSSLILVIVSLGVASATLFQFETKLAPDFEFGDGGSDGSIYIRINPLLTGVWTGGVEATLNKYDKQGYLGNGRVYHNEQELNLSIDEVKSAAFYWVSSSDQPEWLHPIAVDYVKVSAGGKTVKFCGGNKTVKESQKVKLDKC